MALTPEQEAMNFNPELQDVSRQRKLAELLTAKGMEQPQGQIISGRYVAPSWAQQLNPIANMMAGQAVSNRADTEQTQYAKKLRELGVLEAEEITKAQEKGNKAAYIQALRGQTPVSQGMATVLQKQLLEGPDWKEAKIPQADGSEKHGWVNVKSQNPFSTFVEGGTKPSYTQLEGAKFQYETGMQPPGYQAAPQNAPVRPVQQGAPNAPVQTAQPMSNRVVGAPTMASSAMPLSSQAGNQPITATGNAVPVSAMNRPGMSPKDLSEANKQIYTKTEEQRQIDLKALPTTLEQAKTAIKTIDEMIGDARLNDKGEIVYETYDPTSKKWVKSTKEEHGGFGQYVGAGIPYLSNWHGSDTASFRTLYDSIKGQAFLEAFQRLKGAGQITEIEGQKATDALLKLNNAQSEKDFIKYAREFQENLQRGMELAKNKAGVTKEYRSPVGQPALRWNPQTNSWVNQ